MVYETRSQYFTDYTAIGGQVVQLKINKYPTVPTQYDAKPGVPNISLTMHPFSISTEEHVPLNFLKTKRPSEITKIHIIINRSYL